DLVAHAVARELGVEAVALQDADRAAVGVGEADHGVQDHGDEPAQVALGVHLLEDLEDGTEARHAEGAGPIRLSLTASHGHHRFRTSIPRKCNIALPAPERARAAGSRVRPEAATTDSNGPRPRGRF